MSRRDHVRFRSLDSTAKNPHLHRPSLIEGVLEAIEPRTWQPAESTVQNAAHRSSARAPDPGVRQTVQAGAPVAIQDGWASLYVLLGYRGHDGGYLEAAVCEQITHHARDGSPGASRNQLNAATATPGKAKTFAHPAAKQYPFLA